MVSSSIQHKRSLAALPLPTPRSETPTSARWSGDSLAPNDGYSSLFTSGLMRDSAPLPSTPQLKCRPSRAPPSAFFTSITPHKSSTASSLSPFKTPKTTRRRRSSILPSDAASPAKNKSHGTPSQAVESALDNVMRNLRLFARESRSSQIPESRWSDSSSDDDDFNSKHDVGRPSMESHKSTRKSGESTRSKLTIKSKRSIRSLASFKSSRKSDDADRMDVDIWQAHDDDVPPVPAVPVMPITPGRGRRALEGLAKKLGLTPKKSKRSMAPPPELPVPAHSVQEEEPMPLPRPSESMDRSIPRKSSLSTLRSIGKKSSTGTLRSIRTTHSHSSTHPFVALAQGNIITDCEAPPLPTCLPVTPRRPKKSSIGHPKARPTVSPSAFLDSLPRRAPSTPKQSVESVYMDEDEGEIITFGAKADISIGTGTPDLSMDDSFTSSTTRNTSFASIATPPSVDASHSSEMISFNDAMSMDKDGEPMVTPLTAKSAAAAAKPSKILDWMPRDQRANLGFQTPARGMRSAKTGQMPGCITAPQNENTNTWGGRSIPVLNLGGMPTQVTKAAKPRTPSANRTNPTRQPFAALGINHPPLETPALPFRKGGSTPWTNTDGNYFGPSLGTFGASNSNNADHASSALHIHKRPAVPDFSKPMDTSLRGGRSDRSDRRKVNGSMDSTGTTASGAVGSSVSSVSVLGTAESGDEGWELERYLRELEGEDAHLHAPGGSASGPMVI